MKKNVLKLLVAFGLLSSVGFAAYNNQNYNVNHKITTKYRVDYSFKDRVQNRTETKEFNFSNLDRVKLEVDVEGFNGELSFVLLDSKGKEVFRADNPYEFERYIDLNSNDEYKLKVILKNFTGKYEFELESK